MESIMGDITLRSLFSILPELYLAAASVFLLIFGVYRLKNVSRSLVAWAMMALGFTALIMLGGFGGGAITMNGMFIVSQFTVFVKLLILGAAILVLLLSSIWLQEEGGKPFEFVILLLFATLGMLLMVSANDLLAIYMALEMSSLALYVLASFSRDHAKSAEAGLKYFVLGALASGMMLFGMSLVYGFGGSTGFIEISQLLVGGGAISKGLVVGLVLVMVGFCFKLSAVPFHMWTPDVYEGAPTPVTAFFATAPKIAALALFTRFLLEPFGHAVAQWQQVVIAVSLGSMLVGALAAIMQTNIKRLLAYSSIGHVGFMLMGLASANQAGVQAVLIYLALYIFMSTGMFASVLLMKREGHAVENIKDLTGVAQTHPAFAIAIAIFMLSMAGIPPLAGFFGKFYVVMAAVHAGLAWLAVIGVLTSCVGAYYYLKIVKIMYFDEPLQPLDFAMPLSLRISVGVAAAVTFLFFLIPAPLVAQAKIAAEALIP